MDIKLTQADEAFLAKLPEGMRATAQAALLQAKTESLSALTTFGISVSESVNETDSTGKTVNRPGSGILKIKGYGRRPLLIHADQVIDLIEKHGPEVVAFARENLAKCQVLRKAFAPIRNAKRAQVMRLAK